MITNDEHPTPQWFFDALDSEFSFEYDMAAQAHNAKCELYTSRVELALRSSCSVFWMNPPYSDMGRAMRVAAELGERATVVCLVRLDPSTSWFQEHVDGHADEVRMLNKLLQFFGYGNYPFPLCVVVYRPGRVDTRYWLWR